MEEGADVIVGVHNLETAKEIYGECLKVLAIVPMDATKIEDLERLGEAVKKTGRRVKAVVPVVGNGLQNMIPDITPEQRFEAADGSSICFDADYYGAHRGLRPVPGPFA